MATAVRVAFSRHNIAFEEDTATEEEIAADAAGACFGEECCDDTPIPEVTELLKLIAGAADPALSANTPTRCPQCDSPLRSAVNVQCLEQISRHPWHQGADPAENSVSPATPEAVSQDWMREAAARYVESCPVNRRMVTEDAFIAGATQMRDWLARHAPKPVSEEK
jgi:hypothetical protein